MSRAAASELGLKEGDRVKFPVGGLVFQHRARVVGFNRETPIGTILTPPSPKSYVYAFDRIYGKLRHVGTNGIPSDISVKPIDREQEIAVEIIQPGYPLFQRVRGI